MYNPEDYEFNFLETDQAMEASDLEIDYILFDSEGQREEVNHCRFCAQEKKWEELIDLSTDKELMEEYLSILEFFKIDFINLSNVILPKTTCEDCYNQIKDSHRYFQSMREAQFTLNKIYCVKEIDGTDEIQSETLDFQLASINTEDEGRRKFISNTPSQEFTGELSVKEYKPKPSETTQNIDMNTPVNDGSSKCAKADNNCEIPISSNTVSIKHSPETNKTEIKGAKSENKINTNNNNDPWNSYPWTCEHCGVNCDSVDDLRSHGVQQHKKCFAFKCADCDNCVFATFNSFIEHARQHRNYLRYCCPHCNIVFDTISDCSNHAQSHCSDGQRICEWCGKICPDQNALKRHNGLSKHDRAKKKMLRKVRVVSPVQNPIHDEIHKKLHVCDTCGKQFDKRVSLTAHLHCHSTNTYVCKVCDRCFTREKYLKLHVKTHLKTNKFICDHCDRQFNTKDYIKKHMIRNHIIRKVYKKYKCQVCSKLFDTPCYLKNHMHIHNGKRYKCRNCEKSFTSWGNCDKHMTRIHETTLAKTKRTPQGRVPIDKIEKVSISAQANKKWIENVIKNKTISKKKSK